MYTQLGGGVLGVGLVLVANRPELLRGRPPPVVSAQSAYDDEHDRAEGAGLARADDDEDDDEGHEDDEATHITYRSEQGL